MAKVILRYGKIEDDMAKAYCLNGKKLTERASQETDMVFVNQQIKEYRKLWDELGNDKIFSAIEGMTSKPFPNLNVVVNIVWAARVTTAYSMMIPVTHDPDGFVITLSHELMHLSGGIFTPEFKEKYKDETLEARVHIVINAMTEYLWRDVLNKPEYIDIHKERCKKNNAVNHIRAWEIVDEVGYKKIIDTYLI